MHIIQSSQVGFLERQLRVPVVEPDLPPRAAIAPIDFLGRRFMQSGNERLYLVRDSCRVPNKVIGSGEYRPRLQNDMVLLGRAEQFALQQCKPLRSPKEMLLLMRAGRDDERAVLRKSMNRRVRPILVRRTWRPVWQMFDHARSRQPIHQRLYLNQVCLVQPAQTLNQANAQLIHGHFSFGVRRFTAAFVFLSSSSDPQV